VIHINHDTARIVTARISLTSVSLALSFALVVAVAPLAARAQGQSGNGWFVPDQSKSSPVPPAGAARGQPAGPRNDTGPRADTAGVPPPAPESLMPMAEQQGQLPPLQVALPPMPEIPPIPKGLPTPAAVIGVLSVPDVLRVSTAYQAADKELAVRRTKVNEDGQKEQAALRDLGQAFASERAKLSPEQIRAREKEYADRVNESRRMFSERARIIQEAGQYVMGQIERVIEVVAQQVAASRGVNLVLNRAQVLGTTAEFDLTPQVAEVVNRVLPSVVIPPDGVSPTKLGLPMAGPRVSTAPEATPAVKKTESP
jgi:Skp family chaperone for outer membrane proteins